MMLYLLVLLLGAVVAYAIFIAMRKARFYKLIEGSDLYIPPELPIIGNLLTLAQFKNTEDMWDFLTEQAREHPEGGVMWLLHIPMMAIQNLDTIEAVLSSPDAVEKSRVYQVLKPISNGIFIAETNRWRKLRKKLNLMFSPKLMESYLDDINGQAGVLLNQLKEEEGKTINIQHFFERAFYDIVTRTHFGVETFEQIERNDVIHVVAGLLETLIISRLFKPHLHSEFIYKLTAEYKVVARIRNNTGRFLEEVLATSIELGEKEKNNKIKRKYGASYVDYVTTVLEELNIEPNMKSLFYNCLDLVIAASDTTSVAISELMYQLSQAPDVQQKVYEEAVSVYGGDKFRPLTKAEVARLTYLDMAVKESLRFCSPPGIFRELKNDLDVGKYIIPRGTNVYMLLNSIHKNPKYYEKPNDFYPEHFLPENVQKRPKMTFLPFSTGPRNCPGISFAYTTIKIMASSIVRNYHITSDIPIEEVRYKPILMQEHIGGYPIKLTKRD